MAGIVCVDLAVLIDWIDWTDWTDLICLIDWACLVELNE